MSGKADSKQTSGPNRSRAGVHHHLVGARPAVLAGRLATEVAQPSTDRSGMYSPNGTSRILSYVGRVIPCGPTSTEVL